MSDHLAALPRGYQLNNYKIEKVLGSGGFGITYLGLDVEWNRYVAIKEYYPGDLAVRLKGGQVSPAQKSDRQDFKMGLELFRSEGENLVPFRHTNIIGVYSFFRANGTAYMVMEYAEGPTLSSFLKKNAPINQATLWQILDPLLSGMEQVHGAAIWHRDIKPANVILRNDGNPVLIDFGAAKQSLGAKSKSIGAVLTPPYAPIEQYDSTGNQGPWTDIYALGMTAYVALSGTRPPEAPSRMNPRKPDPLIPAVQACQGNASEAFLMAIDQAIAVYEDDRPQSVVEWRATLRHAVETGGQPAPPPDPYDAPTTIAGRPPQGSQHMGGQQQPPYVQQPSQPSAPPQQPPYVQQPSQPSAPQQPPYVEQPSQPSAPQQPPYVEQPSQPSAPQQPPYVEQPSQPSAPQQPPYVEQPSQPSAPPSTGYVDQNSQSSQWKTYGAEEHNSQNSQWQTHGYQEDNSQNSQWQTHGYQEDNSQNSQWQTHGYQEADSQSSQWQEYGPQSDTPQDETPPEPKPAPDPESQTGASHEDIDEDDVLAKMQQREQDKKKPKASEKSDGSGKLYLVAGVAVVLVLLGGAYALDLIPLGNDTPVVRGSNTGTSSVDRSSSVRGNSETPRPTTPGGDSPPENTAPARPETREPDNQGGAAGGAQTTPRTTPGRTRDPETGPGTGGASTTPSDTAPDPRPDTPPETTPETAPETPPETTPRADEQTPNPAETRPSRPPVDQDPDPVPVDEDEPEDQPQTPPETRTQPETDPGPSPEEIQAERVRKAISNLDAAINADDFILPVGASAVERLQTLRSIDPGNVLLTGYETAIKSGAAAGIRGALNRVSSLNGFGTADRLIARARAIWPSDPTFRNLQDRAVVQKFGLRARAATSTNARNSLIAEIQTQLQSMPGNAGLMEVWRTLVVANFRAEARGSDDWSNDKKREFHGRVDQALNRWPGDSELTEIRDSVRIRRRRRRGSIN